MSSYKKGALSRLFFVLTLLLTLTTAILYLYNIFKWGNLPDFGFAFRTATGVNVVGVVTEPGRNAGLEMGDRILKVNGKSFANIGEGRALLNRRLGEKNSYLIERRGHQFEVAVTNAPLGFIAAFNRSGFPYLVGLCYVLIGTLVFLMKPHYRTSWIFFSFWHDFWPITHIPF